MALVPPQVREEGEFSPLCEPLAAVAGTHRHGAAVTAAPARRVPLGA